MDKRLMLVTASNIIKQFGKRIKITHVDGGTSNAFGVVTRPSQTMLDGTSVTAGALVCWLQGTVKRAPAAGDIIKIGVHEYIVESVNRVQPDGSLTYAYAAFVRI